MTLVVTDQIYTLPMQTWVTGTFVDVSLTVIACVSWSTLTFIVVEVVAAGSSMLARVRHTVVDLTLASGAGISLRTFTLKSARKYT